ncbi:hypothetical protein GLP59_07090 [Sulfitobacter sp. M220]|jgi:DNA polymerase III epsilon subunit-like protein|uniref:3'-5' exonuclease n=1 Tax=Sulfitobacter sp. M220 TaxID=2675333 RepID=UPI001F46E82C|nr:exonuclease domain-containing protein [Sulfitobacter sp. M220]MCF7777415.1 hypothetical protein [Sulfitobacter sp. M220]
MTIYINQKIVFLDFEASSLSNVSWPIEIGLSWIESGAIRTWSSLIQPHAKWDPNDWSPQSAKVHGIPRATISNAPHANDVLAQFLTTSANTIVISDAPKFDQRWLDRLMGVQMDLPLTTIEDFHHAAFATFDGYALDIVYETLERRRAPHRAGPDSARLAQAWYAGLATLIADRNV